MGFLNSPTKVLQQQASNIQANQPKNIFADQVELLYVQNPVGITAQTLAALFLAFALWQVVPHTLIISWFIYMLVILSSWLVINFFYRAKATLYATNLWLILFLIFTFFAGTGWGIAGSVLIQTNNLVHQAFVIIIIFGLTAGAIPFFAPVLHSYLLFLLLSFLPFNIWLFTQGGIYILLGLCGLTYLSVIFISCYYVNKFLISTLALRYKNENLGTLNQLLEKRITNRTHDLEKSLAITRSTLESTADGLLVINLNNHIEYFNRKFLAMWDMPEDFKLRPCLETFIEIILKKVKYPQEFLYALKEINNNAPHECFHELIINDEKAFEWYSKPYWLHQVIVGHVWNFRDISLRKHMEQQLAYQATHDLLTGLPNRTLLYDRINQGIAYAMRYRIKLVLMFLDIDNFKLINDNLGHNLGDILLQAVAQSLRESVRASDTVARFGGDEFVILFLTDKDEEALHLAQKILHKVTQPILLKNHEIVVTASIGVSIYPFNGKDAATLLKNADMAMYLAKSQGRNNYKLYDETIKKQTKKSLETQIELRNALANHEFFLLYQPTINLRSGRIIGVEALLRWKHPKKGIIHPLQFITIAEESRLIVPLGEWVFRQACQQNKKWQEQGLRAIRMAINVSGVQLMREDFAENLETSLTEIQLNPKYIELELTESTIMDDSKQNLSTLKRLNNLGINITIDDFGKGYSSLNYLREFPVNRLKIDCSFIRDCITDPNSASIIEAIIAMGHGLKLKVLAEGIEKIEQLKFLQQCHCDEGQGFLYGQPMSAQAFARLLEYDKNMKPVKWA